MKKTLAITVRYYEGRYHGSDGWPPAPARLFQALMAGAARGAFVPQSTLDALNWLESLPPPVIAAPSYVLGCRFLTYVPSNDRDVKVDKLRVGKRVSPILFDPNVPILYHWYMDYENEQAQELCQTAKSLFQLGWGIDMAWAEASIVDQSNAQKQLKEHSGSVYYPAKGGNDSKDLACPRNGTSQSLVVRFSEMRNRLRNNSFGNIIFAQPPKPLTTKIAYNAPPYRYIFDIRECSAKSDLASRRLKDVAMLVSYIRDKVASRLSETLPAQRDDITRYLVGREATDADKTKRVRIIPVPSVGHFHADMRIRRVLVYVPQACPLNPDDLAWGLTQVRWTDANGDSVSEFQVTGEDDIAKHFESNGRSWRSITPLALPMFRRRHKISPDQHGKSVGGFLRSQEEAHATHAVRQALRHSGIDQEPVEIRVQREPFDARGEKAGSFALGTRFPQKSLWHTRISFAEPVSGPVLLGNGRYLGLGLMLPYEPMRGVLSFAITDGLVEDADPIMVANSARRAMIARAQNCQRGKNLSSYISGHDNNGGPSRSGEHRHIAVIADLPRQRVLFASPDWLQRNAIAWREISKDHNLVERALSEMGVLLAGKAGRLNVEPTIIDAEHDPLFSISKDWVSITDYQVTRHYRRLSDKNALKTDVLYELQRRNWPKPKKVEILATRRGSRGGLSGRLLISFATAQKGLLLLGRTSHKGGGLFANSI